MRGSTWLAYTPHPQAQQDLAGDWTPTKDALRYTAPFKLPGTWDALLAKNTVRIDAAQADRQVYLHVEGERMLGVIINGHMVRRHHHLLGNITHLNITPWVKFGSDNTLELFKSENGRTTVKSLSLYFYDKGRD